LTFRLERRLSADDLADDLRREAREGLTATPKRMRSRWLWDHRAAGLYERIMELPAYYLPAAERALLERHAGEVATLVQPGTVVELGSGSAVKTPILLDALPELERYVAVDVSEPGLEAAGKRLAERYRELEILGIVGDFERDLPAAPGPVLVVSLGSTFGGLEPEDRRRLLDAVAKAIEPDGALLLGLDLLKPVERILAAYDVEDGVTAELIANVLLVLNRELDGDFDRERFRSEAVWDPDRERMEMFVRALEPQTVTLRAIDLIVEFAEDERLRTEISTKFRRESIDRELEAAGLRIADWWEDEAGEFALCLARLANSTYDPVAPGGEGRVVRLAQGASRARLGD
jgi:L-histidine Nalpha-methyltransferase